MAPSPSSRRPLMRRLTAVCVFSVFSGFFCTSVDSFRPNDAPNSYPDPAVSEHTTTQGIIQPDAFSAVQTSTRVSTNEEGESLAAYMDLQRALEASAAGVSVDLPHSTEFAEAFVEYKNTGICDSWTDSSTNKVSTGLSEERMEELLLQRDGEKPQKPQLEEDEQRLIVEQLTSGDDDEVAVAVLESVFRPLPLTCLVIGSFVLLLYIFFLLPQKCCMRCRRLCCCLARKTRQFSSCFVLCCTVFGGLLAAAGVYMIIHGQASMQQSLHALGASSCSALEAVQTAEWGYQGPPLLQQGDTSSVVAQPRSVLSQLLHAGSSSSSSSNSFLGVRLLMDALKGIEGLLTAGSSSSVSQMILDYVNNRGSLEQNKGHLSKVHTASSFNLKELKKVADEHFMKNLFIESVETLGDGVYTSLLASPDSFTSAVTKAVQQTPLPSVDLTSTVDLQPLTAATSELERVAAEATRTGGFVAVLGPLLLWTEVAFVFLAIAFAVVALILFLGSKGKRSETFSGIAWILLLLITAVGLLLTGGLFLGHSLGDPLCSWGIEKLWGQQPAQDTHEGDNHLGGHEGEFSLGVEASDTLKRCVTDDSYNFLEEAGQPMLISQAQESLQKAQDAILKSMPQYQASSELENVEKIQQSVNDLGYLFIFDQEKLAKDPSKRSLLDTFPEILNSGIQLTTTTVSIAGESTKVLGLSDVSKFLYPFALEGFEGVNPTITITADYPEPEDGNFVLALDAVEAKKRQELQAQGDIQAISKAADYRKKFRNAALLCKLKLQILEKMIPCYRFSSNGDPIRTSCSGKEFFGQPKLGDWNVVEQSVYYLTVASRHLNESMQRYTTEVSDYIKGMLGLLQAILSNLSDSLNCSFVREHMLTSAYLGCYEGIDRSWNAAMLRLIGELCAVLLGLLLFVLWRMQRDNSQLQRQHQKHAEQQPLRGEGETEKVAFDETGVDATTKERETEQPVEGSSSMWA